MRSRIVAAVIAAGLLDVSAARAQDPCAEDVKQLCADVRVGGGRVQDCLRKNEAKLSPACSAKRAAADARFRSLVAEFSEACRRDTARLCSDVKPGHGRVVACLIRQLDDLSSSCRAEAERVQEAQEKITAVRASCRADADRLCPGITEAGPFVECLQANRASVSETCSSAAATLAPAAVELVDALDELSSEEKSQEAQQILQGIETIAFSRSQVLLQIDSFHGLLQSANANRLTFNPQIVFGSRREFSFQLKAPVFAVYPYAPDRPAQTGLGAVTTSLAWSFLGTTRVHHYLSLGLQWISPEQPPVGAAWAVTPGYAISVSIVGPLSVTGQLAWIRSFASGGYPELNILLLDPIVVVNLPGRTFLALDTKLGWNFVDGSFVPLMKGIVGIYTDRRKSLSISAWFQSALSREAEADAFKFGVGTALAYFFDW